MSDPHEKTREATFDPSSRADLTARDEEFLYLVGDGSDLMRAGRVEDALREFDRALAIRPSNEQALNLKGLCLFRLGRSEEAARVFEALVVQNGQEPSLRLNLAMAYLKLGDDARARDALSHVLAQSPAHPRARNLMELVNERLGVTDDPPAIVGVLEVAPAVASDTLGDEDVPAPPTLSELDFAIAMGGGMPDASLPDVGGGLEETVDVPAPPPLSLVDDVGGASLLDAVSTSSDDETLDVPAPAEDDFSELNDDLDAAPVEPDAVTEPRGAPSDAPEPPRAPRPVEETLPAYDIAAFNAHIARKEAERAAREAALAAEVEAAARARREAPRDDDDHAPPRATPEVDARATAQGADDAALPPKLSVGAEAAALVAASTAALRRDRASREASTISEDAAATRSERTRQAFGLAIGESSDDAAKTDDESQGAMRIASLIARGRPGATLPRGLVSIAIADALYLRTDLLIALSGELDVEPVNRRYRGRRTDSFFGGTRAPLSAALGHGRALLRTADDEVTVLHIEAEDVYLLESAIVAFTDGIVWENGRLPGEAGDDLDIVHLRGAGLVYLRSARPVVGLSVGGELPVTIHATALVGWQGQVVPFRGPFPGLPESVSRPPTIRFEGTGTVLIG